MPPACHPCSCSIQDEEFMYIFLEFMQCSIRKHLEDFGPLSELAIADYTRQILEGLVYLHEDKGIMHR